MEKFFLKNNRIMQIVAAALIVCMGLCDASLYINYVRSEKNTTDDCYVVTEEHEMETAWADGEYEGNNSDSPVSEDDTVYINERKTLFNILEIVPTEKKAVIGYTVKEHEPFTYIDKDGNEKPVTGFKQGEKVLATPGQMKEAYMDAIINAYPGTKNNTNSPDTYKIYDLVYTFPQKLSESGTTTAFECETNKSDGYKGYYKWVGENNGVFACTNYDDYMDPNKDVEPEFASKFYGYNSNYKYNYIFVYSDDPSEAPDINVTNHIRIKYVNNDKFIKDCILDPGEDYDTWKAEHEVEITARAPQNVTEADIERADAIVINSANSNEMDYYDLAVRIYNRSHGIADLTAGSDAHFGGTDETGRKIDFLDFDRVLQIYERVVVRKDVAFSASKLCLPSPSDGDYISSNMEKLMIMLFFVKKDGVEFAGREFFTDFLKRYTSEPGTKYMTLRNEYDQHKKYENGHWMADPLYPDYRAMSLRSTEDKDNPAYYYMHYHTNQHVGHPLVLNKEDAITGGSFNNAGELVPLHYDTNVGGDGKPKNLYKIDLERYSKYVNMFNDERKGYRIDYKENRWDSGGQILYHENAYESMSNTTDYVYIAERDDIINGIHAGDLVIDDKYSSDKGVYNYTENGEEHSANGAYWFKIDPDGAVGNSPHAFRRRIWSKESYSAWPWDSNLSVWLMKRTDETQNSGYDCNLHLWYDYTGYFVGSKYTGATGDPSLNTPYENQIITGENGMLKSTYLHSVIHNRKLKREKEDPNHMSNEKKEETTPSDYYISMNILNGDGFNKKGANKNKTLYFNFYEKKDIQNYETSNNVARIPIKLRIKSSCKLDNITVYLDGSKYATYTLNTELENNVGKIVHTIDKPGKLESSNTATKNNLVLNRTAGTYKVDGTDELGNVKWTPVLSDGTSMDKTDFNNLKYTFDGSILDLFSPLYIDKRNTTVKVVLNVTAPDGTHKKVEDDMTIVRRDFFSLN